MEFIQLLVQISEILHGYITRYKEEFIGKSKYSDVTVNQLIYLEAIFHLGDPTLSELADHLRISRASASVGVGKLAAAGLAQKTRSSADSRVHHVRLTKEGSALIQAEVKALSAFADRIKEALSEDEIKTLTEIFQKVVARGGEGK
jgi:DNA-binding MarR family transcriptional regulator